MSAYLYRLARWCYGHRRGVLVAWIAVAVAVVAVGVVAHGTENDNITIPGTESQQVVSLLQKKLPAYSGAQTQVALVSKGTPSVTSSAYASGIDQAVDRMDRVPQVAEVINPLQAKAVSPDGKEALVVRGLPDQGALHQDRRRPSSRAARRRNLGARGDGGSADHVLDLRGVHDHEQRRRQADQAIITVTPANTTELPAVPTAVAIDSSIGRPASSCDRCR